MKKLFWGIAGFLGVFVLYGFCYAQSTTSADLSIVVGGRINNGVTNQSSYAIGQAWILNFTSGFPDEAFSLCAVHPDGGTSCTPSGVTNGTGGWTGSGNFDSTTAGKWREWVELTGENINSNSVNFTVNPAADGSGSSLDSAASQTLGDGSDVNANINNALQPISLLASTSGQASGATSTSSVSTGTSCDSSSAAATLSGILAQIDSIAATLSSSNLPGPIALADQNLLDANTQILAQLAACLGSRS